MLNGCGDKIYRSMDVDHKMSIGEAMKIRFVGSMGLDFTLEVRESK